MNNISSKLENICTINYDVIYDKIDAVVQDLPDQVSTYKIANEIMSYLNFKIDKQAVLQAIEILKNMDTHVN